MQTIDFESGAQLVIGPAHEQEGVGIPTIMTADELVELIATLANVLRQNPDEGLFIMELPFVLHSPN